MRRGTLLIAALALQACGGAAPELFRGDRVTIDRDFIYLDDPVFLQSRSAQGRRLDGWFAFRLPIYFNAGPDDTLRLAPGGIAVEAADGSGRFPCLADTGAPMRDPEAMAKALADTARTLVLPPRCAGPTQVDVNFYCQDYRPPWGRMDTLTLAFGKKSGAEAFREVAFRLPLHTSYRGPVVSILVGLGLLYAFTQLGWWISGS